MAILLSNFLSRRLVRNIERAAAKIKKIQESGKLSDRINLAGRDEVVYLTSEFDKLLEKFEDSQNKLIEAEKVQAKVQMAKEIAHNIKSPIIAIEMMLPTLGLVHERMRNVLYNSVKEIKTLAEKLKRQADSFSFDKTSSPETMYLPNILQDLVAQKQLEHSSNPNIQIILKDETRSEAFVSGCSIELKSIISNLINNAVESYGSQGGPVEIKLYCDSASCFIEVADKGVGIPKEFLSDIGNKQISFKGNKCRGLGLPHAFKTVQNWGAIILVSSELGKGTSIKIEFKKSFQSPTLSNAVIFENTY
ncbi:MAG: HAMP domain-containing histidine kinase [Oligoflexia bacterium]|nr:HAMP domain-containing histidine kinase [Oligoflexia bacterium]